MMMCISNTLCLKVSDRSTSVETQKRDRGFITGVWAIALLIIKQRSDRTLSLFFPKKALAQLSRFAVSREL
ncbi:hypothetical protein JOY44_05675 [Phormidium sp. CLA17]|uniref:hypothetical protein n=1 Tax=Leptolyngbya sp. Cla-17 TaxID=2803751 RepID=UPI001490A145|nr:hypothetical protein [Leptolyngbya sp. Cla-17]MBM0741111.1 hypothetical protein [Leptolyngbya sp. Cla-17]